MAKKKIDPKKLDKFDNHLLGLWKTIGKLTEIYKTMSEQEQTLIGGVMVQIKTPWSGKKFSVMIGEKEFLGGLVTDAVNELQRGPVPPKPVFKPEDDKIIN